MELVIRGLKGPRLITRGLYSAGTVGLYRNVLQILYPRGTVQVDYSRDVVQTDYSRNIVQIPETG